MIILRSCKPTFLSNQQKWKSETPKHSTTVQLFEYRQHNVERHAKSSFPCYLKTPVRIKRDPGKMSFDKMKNLGILTHT